MFHPQKVVIFGAGAIGPTIAYALAQKTLADEISIIDVTREYGECKYLKSKPICQLMNRNCLTSLQKR